MSKWDKLLERICSLSKGLRFEELQKVLESFWVCDERSQRRQQPLYLPKTWMPADYHTKARTHQKGLCRNGQTSCGK